MLDDLDYVIAKLGWMRRERIWPNGLRYLWTDAFGLVLLLSLHRATGEQHWLDEAEELALAVEKILGRARGFRIGEAPDRDGQYYHYLAMWLTALARFGEYDPVWRSRGVAIVHAIHRPFVIPNIGVVWKMKEDLSAPYPGYGFGAMDAFDGYVAYRLLDEVALADEIAEMKTLIDLQYPALSIDQDLGLGMMLWLSHFFPHEPWARVQRDRSIAALDALWTDPPGYFARASHAPAVRIAFANYGVALGLQAADVWPDRVDALNRYFESYRSGDEYDREAITHVMACTSHFPGAMLALRAHAAAGALS